MRETFGVEAVAVFALPGPGRDLRLLGGTVRPRAEADLPRTVPFGRGPLGRGIDLGCTLAYSRGRGGEAEDSTLPASASEIAVPLAQAGRSLGGLLLASAVPDRFGPADAQLLEAAGASIAQALGNALAAERLQELRNDLSRMVVHDVRNPMMVILTALSVLERNAAVLADERSQRYLRNATAAGDEILRLMTSLLDIEKLESGTLALHRVPYAVEDALTRVVENGRILAEVQELALALDVAPGLPPVLADVDLLLRTFENVLGNALKFTPAGGAVRVAARLATPEELAARLPEAPGAVLVEVVDNGPGIPDEEQARVFEKFGVVESRRRHGKASTGLGLALCKLVISAHGGAIWVESRLGAGARFVILLPASE